MKIEKSTKDIANYLPPNKNYHCQYLDKWLLIKNKYKLKFDDK